MIISASYKTDIPAFYGRWFMNRLKAGHAAVVNPYGGQRSRVPLTPDAVDGFVFWTRNLGPFLENLHEISDAGFSAVVHFTITGYPRALDDATIAPERAVAQVREVARLFGPRAAVWRYDPIVATSLTPASWHRTTFAGLAAALAGAVDEVVVSFAHIYRKTARNMATAARAHRFDWSDPDSEEKTALLVDLAATAAGHGMTLSLCGQSDLLAGAAVEARCIDAERLGDVAGRPLDIPRRPHRPCGCWASRDIGEYDTCPHGCVYCYAVSSRTRAKQRFRDHDPNSEFLLPPSV